MINFKPMLMGKIVQVINDKHNNDSEFKYDFKGRCYSESYLSI